MIDDINTIVQQLNIAKNMYYNTGKPIMSDEDFDVLELKLKALDPTNPYFNEVGVQVRGVKAKLSHPMGSLDPVYNDQEINAWLDIIDDASTGNPPFVISAKLDGSSIQLIYDENGRFKQAITRGDGIEGLDITRHINRIIKSGNNTIPEVYEPDTVIRGEMIMAKEIFDLVNINANNKFKNPRNYVAGQLNRNVADDDFIANVDFFAFDLFENGTRLSKSVAFASMLRSFKLPLFQITSREFIYGLDKSLKTLKDTYEYECDGWVIEVDDGELIDKLGYDGLNPVFARKYKINLEFVEAEVVAVHWTPSMDGYLKPRVEIDPIELNGVTISFATGFNAKFILDNVIGPGSKVTITRSGDVIPYIVKVEEREVERLDLLLPPPDYGTYHWNETGVDLILDKLPDSSIILSLTHFFEGIDAPLLKEGNVTKLYEGGFNTLESIIKATEDDLVTILGENGHKAYMGLRDRLMAIPAYVVAGSVPFFGRGIGKRKIKKIIDLHGSDWTNLELNDIVQIEGFDTKTAQSVIYGLEEWETFVNDLKDYMSLEYPVTVVGELTGRTFVFTGVRDKALETELESKGAKIGSSVTKDTTDLICKDPFGKSGKLDKARKMGVKLHSIEDTRNGRY